MQVTKSPSHGVETATLVDIGDTSSPGSRPATDVNGQGAVPGKPSDDDFDMFAQSRQSFQENLPRVKYVTL